MAKLDELYRAPLQWPATNRTANMENAFLKAAALGRSSLTPETSLPFSAIESKFLIGLAFRLKLRDIIYSSQRRNDHGVLQKPIRKSRREPVYQEILQYSYQDYFEKCAVPHYQAQGVASLTAETMEKSGDLRTYDAGLRANPKIRVITNQNDFLLTNADLQWLRATFAPHQLTIFTQGGHMGNLSNPEVQQTMVEALAGLNESPSESE